MCQQEQGGVARLDEVSGFFNESVISAYASIFACQSSCCRSNDKSKYGT